MGDAQPEDSQPEPKTYYALSWEQVIAGVYLDIGGRFRITRRGSGKWILIDDATRQQMRFDTLRDAQSRAEWVLNNTK